MRCEDVYPAGEKCPTCHATPTPEAVERVARAIREAMPVGQVTRAAVYRFKWEEMQDNEREWYRVLARAALAAMREA